MIEPGHKRCVCGLSEKFPLCDGEHGGADWSCSATTDVELVVVAGRHLRSVAERLAHHLGGIPLLEPRSLAARRALVLTDGTELDTLRSLLEPLTTERTEALAIDVPGGAIHGALGIPVRSVPPHEPLHLWRNLLRALEEPVSTEPLRRAFLSHAVADEARLEPVVAYLRQQLGAELFVCADSIPGGSDWRSSIVGSLERAEVFVYLSSEASRSSTYCAFETGYAMARDLPIRVVMLDAGSPPPFLSQLQAIDLPRLQARRPWLSADEALVEALLDALSGG